MRIKNIRMKAGLILGVGLMCLTACNVSKSKETIQPIKFYVGSSGGEQEYSIFLCEYDPGSNAFSVLDSFAGSTGSSYLDLSPDGKALYAISREELPGDSGHNSVTSFRVDREDHSLELINKQSSQGSGPCHIHVAPTGDYLFTANYNCGHVAALPVEADGLIEAASAIVRGEGSGPVESRQKSPHAHQAMTDPGGNYLLVPDLGTDKIMNYSFDHETGELVPNPKQSFLEMAPGAGPRHMAFHPSGKFVYIVNELNATVTACHFDGSSGVLSTINSASIVEDSFSGNKQSAAVRVHPGGKYVYASNRDEQSCIGVFRVEENGAIQRIQIMEKVPYWPRDFNITPDGKYLLVAGARVDEIEVFRIDQATGMIESLKASMKVPSPTCILFIASESNG